ncbi:MAG: phospholipase D-like domain-containing protein [Ruminiclostridium sp.]
MGTANIDIRSFSLNFEIDAFMYGEEISQRCIKIFNNDLNLCTIINEKKFKNRSAFSKIQENVFRLLSPLL